MILAPSTSPAETFTSRSILTVTGCFFSASRCIREYCSSVTTKVGGAMGFFAVKDPAASALRLPL